MTVKEHIDRILKKVKEDEELEWLIQEEHEQYLRAYEEAQERKDEMEHT